VLDLLTYLACPLNGKVIHIVQKQSSEITLHRPLRTGLVKFPSSRKAKPQREESRAGFGRSQRDFITTGCNFLDTPFIIMFTLKTKVRHLTVIIGSPSADRNPISDRRSMILAIIRHELLHLKFLASDFKGSRGTPCSAVCQRDDINTMLRISHRFTSP
jgi:hypothetical protein